MDDVTSQKAASDAASTFVYTFTRPSTTPTTPAASAASATSVTLPRNPRRVAVTAMGARDGVGRTECGGGADGCPLLSD